MKEYQKLKELIASMEEDLNKFGEKGNASAGMRLRKILQDIKKTAQDMRFEIQEIKKKNKAS
jgi:hypothetical protein